MQLYLCYNFYWPQSMSIIHPNMKNMDLEYLHLSSSVFSCGSSRVLINSAAKDNSSPLISPIVDKFWNSIYKFPHHWQCHWIIYDSNKIKRYFFNMIKSYKYLWFEFHVDEHPESGGTVTMLPTSNFVTEKLPPQVILVLLCILKFMIVTSHFAYACWVLSQIILIY